MTPTISNLDKFTAEIERVLNQAAKQYNLPTLTSASIRYNLRGQCAGQAIHEGGGRLILRFNLEAVAKDFDGMHNDTIPHEVAHLVCFLNPSLGRNHNKGWKRVCESLGGSSERCHTIELTPAKKRSKTRFLYILEDGTEVKLTKNAHKKIGLRPGQLYMRAKHTNSGRRIDLYPSQFVKQITID